jgi:hypothetical protein
MPDSTRPPSSAKSRFIAPLDRWAVRQISSRLSQHKRIEIADLRRAELSLRAQIGNSDALVWGLVARTDLSYRPTIQRRRKSDYETVEAGRVSA